MSTPEFKILFDEVLQNIENSHNVILFEKLYVGCDGAYDSNIILKSVRNKMQFQ